MPPRKSSRDASSPEGTRRSSRIASNPASAPASKAKKPSSTKEKSDGASTKKRAAKEEGGQTLAKKKAKTDAEDEDQIEDDGSGEGEGAVSGADIKELQVGDNLPDITLKNEKGEDVIVSSLTSAEQGVVFFLVPRADTPGCTTQACLFRDSYSEFKTSSYAVYCISADTPQAQKKWQDKKELPYPLLSDPKRTFIKSLGSFKPPKSTTRSHFIFEKGTGKLIEKKSSVKPAESAKSALEFIKKHRGLTGDPTGEVKGTEGEKTAVVEEEKEDEDMEGKKEAGAPEEGDNAAENEQEPVGNEEQNANGDTAMADS